jgi:hypothetical protein
MFQLTPQTKFQKGDKKKFTTNTLIQENNLFGTPIEGDIAKKLSIGGIIITRRSIAEELIKSFNHRQRTHMQEKTFPHKFLCERREEAAGLIFLTLQDMLGETADYRAMDRQELCHLVQTNIQFIVEKRLSWLISYSKHIIRDYYSLSTNRLKIKLNFLLDDGKYEPAECDEKVAGGLILNGFLDELLFYKTELDPFINEDTGVICRVLCPSGLPRSKKWIQIDVGISFTGKRNYMEPISQALIRKAAEEIHIGVAPTVCYAATKLYYGHLPHGVNYEGFEIHIWEVLYDDQIYLMEEQELNVKFCKCDARTNIINQYRNTRKSGQ